MKLKYIFILSIFCSFNTNAIELKDGLNNIFKSNPSLQNAKKNLEIQKELLNQSKSNFMPDLSASYSLYDKHTNYEGASSTDNSPSSGSISLSQDLFKGGANIASFKKATFDYQKKQNNFIYTQQQTFEEASDAYLSVLTAQEVLDLNKRQVTTSKEEMKRLKQRFDLGDITLPQLKEFEARLAGYIADKEEAFGDLLATKAKFLSIFGEKAENLSWPELKTTLPSSLEEAINIAKKKNPQIIEAKLAINSAKENIKVSRANFMPSVTADASWSNNSNNGSTDSNITKFGVSASIPLFKGGENLSKYNESKIKELQARDSLQETIRDITASADIAFNKILVQKARVESFKIRLDSFTTTTDAVEKQEAAGEASIIDVLDARDDEFSAQVDLQIAQKALVLAKLNLLSILGDFSYDNLNNIFK